MTEREQQIIDTYKELGCYESTASLFNVSEKRVRNVVGQYRNELDNLHIDEKKKILIFDIETAPMEAYVWSMWKNNISQSQLIQDWTVLCWAAKWLGDDKINTGCVWPTDNIRDDYDCVFNLRDLLDEADIVVSHNGDKFDIKRINTRILKHGLQQPRPFKSVDTLKVAKSRFCISSNRLDFIGEFLGVGRKVQHEGFDLWKKVLHGDAEAQNTMLNYNVGDITLLEQVYLAIRGWDKRSPNVNMKFGSKACPVCGSDDLTEVGDAYTNVSTFSAYRCNDCGKYSRSGKNKKTKDDMQNTMRNIM